jgi:hypothetical protein
MAPRARGKKPAPLPSPPAPWSEEGKALFLEYFLEEGSVRQAAAKAGVTWATVYRHRQSDPAFRAGMDKVLAMLRDGDRVEIERSVLDRVLNGTTYKRFDKEGNVVEEGVRHDGKLAARILAVLTPDPYNRATGMDRLHVGDSQSPESQAMRLVAAVEAMRADRAARRRERAAEQKAEES